MTVRRGLTFAFLAPPVTALIAACGGGSTEPARVATTVVVTPPSVTFSAVGATQQLTAKVLDQLGDTIVNAGVTWSSDAAGVATVNGSGLVTAVGNGAAQVTATAGTASRDVSVRVSQTPAAVVKVSGDQQTGTVGQALAQPLVVRVNDANGNGIPSLRVNFAITQGDGTLGAAADTTDVNGQAQTTWTLGQSAGAQSMSASATGLAGSPVTFTATATAGPAASVASQAGDNQTATSGTPVATPPSVIVTDQFSNVKAGAIVTFAVASGGGSVTKPIDTTDASGIASVGSWTLSSAGTNTLTATVTGSGISGNPVTFTATATVGNVVAFAGDNQTGLVGFAVNIRPAVRFTDAGGGPVASASVTFAVVTGGGSVTSATVVTTSNGVAQVGSWVLGSSAGTNTLTATVSGTGIVGNPVTFAATGATKQYDIAIRNIGPAFSAAVQSAFDAAEAFWERIIYGDQTDIPINTTNACGEGVTINETVDDVIILAKFDSIDGPGSVLGSAGACSLRAANGLSIYGVMRFDTADVAGLAASGQLNTVILHEMGHVLGFSPGIWNLTNPPFNITRTCLQNLSQPLPNPVVNDTYFNCPSSLSRFDSIGGTSYTGGNKVPIENGAPSGGNDGTINAHWRESVFGNELMTGFLNSGQANPLSVLTISSFEDIGYLVNYAAAEAYSKTFTLPPALVRAGFGTIDLGNDLIRVPIEVVDRSGRVVRIIPR